MTRLRRGEGVVLVAFAASGAASVALAVVYWAGGDAQLEGVLLAAALGGIALGLVTWANRLLDEGPSVEEREPLSSGSGERLALAEDVERAGELGRRRILLRGLVGAVAALGVAAVSPLRSLGPSPTPAVRETAWRRGRRLVDDAGRPVRAGDVPVGGLVTVFPDGHPGSADGQAVLVHVDEALVEPRPGREGWSPSGFLAYSKVCTHAGCPVGLYQAEIHQLLCPCHQSAFDVLAAAQPVFGPAAWPLPQLPLSIDDEGFLRAEGDFSEPVGPGWWRVG